MNINLKININFMPSFEISDSPFEGKQVKLRALELTDLPQIMKHWNTYETRIGLGRYIPESIEQREEWIKKVTKENQSGKSYTFTIIDKQTEEFLGTCALQRINPVSRNASLSVVILNPENQNKGFGTDTVNSLLKIGFDVLNLHRIELHVFEFLKSGIHVYEKAGFKKTGVRRKSSFIAGKYYDDIIMDILEEEYREMNKL